MSKRKLKQLIKQSILNKIKELYHKNHGTIGYRKMTFELLNLGVKISSNTVLKYMQELGLQAITYRKYHYKKGSSHKVFPNLLDGDFSASKPNQKWCIDFTYLPIKDGKTYYNASIIDLYKREVIASVTREKCDTKLAIYAVCTALLQAKSAKNIILHSDQGSQFTSKLFADFCANNKIRQSMSRAGSPTENAPMERFFNTLKNEFFNLFEFDNFENLNKSLRNFVFVRYNHTRPHTYNHGLAPSKARHLHKCA